MEYVRKQTINFRDDRTPLQRRVSIGYEGDNLVERLEFVLPELVGGQVAKLMITGADAVTLNRVDDGRYAVDLTREMIGPDGKRDAYVRIDGASGQIWQSAPLRIVTGKLPDIEEEIEKTYPTAVGQMLTAMAEHTGEMEAQEERVERAAQRAEEAAERAETGGGSGGPGEDGGYYQPSVTDGVLTWTPSKADMPGVPASDVRGLPGKTAYQYAQDGGYEGTEAEFAEKMAQELPEPYILPVATADRLGGVKVGNGLVMDGEALGVESEGEYELIDTITVGSENAVLRSAEPDGTPYNFRAVYVDVLAVPASKAIPGVISFNGKPAGYYPNFYGTNTAAGQRTRVIGEIRDGLFRYYSVSARDNGATGNIGDRYAGSINEEIKTITSVRITMINGETEIPEGAVITIKAVRSK